MEIEKNKRFFSEEELEKIRMLSIPDYLARKGFKGKWIGGTIYFASPDRPGEKRKSFAVTPKAAKSGKDLWFDHGSGEGGDIIALAEKLERRGFQEALRILDSSGILGTQAALKKNLIPGVRKDSRELENIQSLQNANLIKYVQSREISPETARKHLEEIHYKYKGNGESYYALAFPNESGGYELKNEIYPYGIWKTKDISVIEGENPNSGVLVVFEAFMDFLSGLEYWNRDRPKNTTVVLNTMCLAKKIKDELEGCREIQCFLDRDKAGKKALDQIRAISGNIKVADRSSLYSEHKDFNEFWMSRKDRR